MTRLVAVLFVLGLFTVPVLAQESCPTSQPTAELERLYYFLGEWTAEETWNKCDMCPEGDTGTSVWRFDRAVGGAFIELEYITMMAKAGIHFQGKGIYGYDAAKKTYTHWWFGSCGTCCPSEGTFEGSNLIFENEMVCNDEACKGRFVYEVKGHNEFTFRMYCATTGTEFQEVMTSSVKRIGGRLTNEAGDASAKSEAGFETTKECCKKAAAAAAAGTELPECCKAKEAAMAAGTELPECCKEDAAQSANSNAPEAKKEGSCGKCQKDAPRE